MDLLRIIRSFEELLYELTSWLLFYPRTLWQSVRHPVAIMDYVAAEQAQDDAEQFTDALSPPLLLFVTILLAHGVELGTVGVAAAASGPLAKIYASEQTLLLFRALLFSLFPLMGAAQIVRRSGVNLGRDTLRTPFFALCCAAAPFALLVSVGVTLIRTEHPMAKVAGNACLIGGVLFYLGAQGAWMKRTLKIGSVRAAVLSSWASIQTLLYLLVVVILASDPTALAERA